MDKIDAIIVHCSATKAGQDFKAKDIDYMHRQKGWRMIGYNYVIDLDGTIEEGRPNGVSYNRHSIGICYVGGLTAKGQPGDTRTTAQREALRTLIGRLVASYPIKEILGHRDTSPDRDGDGEIEPAEWIKMCPCFDARDEYKDLLG